MESSASDPLFEFEDHVHFFADVLTGLNASGVFVEVGVQKAHFSSNLLAALEKQGRIGAVEKMYLVDTWEQYSTYTDDGANVENARQIENFKESIDRTREYWGRLSFLQLDSGRAARLFDNESLAFVYLDARHDYCGVLDDIRAYWPKIQQNGLIAGDDYGWSNRWKTCANGSTIVGGVKRAVHDFFSERQLSVLPALADQWAVQKPSWYGPE